MIPATGINVTPDTIEISEGATAQLSVELTPPDSTDAITFESDAPDIASVSDSGLVTGKSEGDANITVKAGDQASVCSVKVTTSEQVTITINPTPAEATVILNDTEQKSVEVLKGSEVTYSVSAEGYETETKTIIADQTKTVDVTLNKIQVTITINPTPADATVMLNEEQQSSVTVDYGSEVSYVVSREGYKSKSDTVIADETKTVDVTLEADTVTFSITATPAEAVVKINDVQQSSITVTRGQSVSYSVEAVGYDTKSDSVQVNEDTNLQVTLDKTQVTHNGYSDSF